MSRFHHLSANRQSLPTNTPLENQPDIQRLLDTMQSILSQLRRPTDLAPLKPTRRAVRAKAAIGMTGDGKSHFWARQNPKDPAWDPTFPASFKLDDSPRSATVWFEDEIQAWLEARASASRKVVPPVGICRRRKHPSETTNSAAEVTP
jgi:predicted DNA-binding transcriptional regulator AlpA